MAAGGGSDAGSDSGGSDMADFVGAFESDSDDGELPPAPEPEPEPEQRPAAAPQPLPSTAAAAKEPEQLPEPAVWAALRDVAGSAAGAAPRSAVELERLVMQLRDWRSVAVQQQLTALCAECAQQEPNEAAATAVQGVDGAEAGEELAADEEDANRGVIRVLTAAVNAVDAERCEVDEGLLELMLQLKGAVGAAAAGSGGSGSANDSIWRYQKVRSIPVLPVPWPELASVSAAAAAVDSAMHVGLARLGGPAAMGAVAASLAAHGMCTCSGFLPRATAAKARSELADAAGAALFKPALKGGDSATPRDDVVLWLDPSNVAHRDSLPTLLDVEARLSELGSGLCRVLTSSVGGAAVALTGRSGAMAACYKGNGAQYRPHIDNPCEPEFLAGGAARADDGRRLTAIWYPNEEDWDVAKDGAALRVWTTASKDSPFGRKPDGASAAPVGGAGGGVVDVCPSGGTLALFWAHRTAHAVLPATGNRPRYAVSVWFNA